MQCIHRNKARYFFSIASQTATKSSSFCHTDLRYNCKSGYDYVCHLACIMQCTYRVKRPRQVNSQTVKSQIRIFFSALTEHIEPRKHHKNVLKIFTANKQRRRRRHWQVAAANDTTHETCYLTVIYICLKIACRPYHCLYHLLPPEIWFERQRA